MTTLSTHVLDVERGIPARGVAVSVFAGDRLLAEAMTNADGRIADFGAGSFSSGTYRLVFDIAPYFASQGRPATFLQRVSIDFEIDADAPHYHVPLLMSAYACTSYRGS